MTRPITRFPKILLPLVALIGVSLLYNLYGQKSLTDYYKNAKQVNDASFAPPADSPGLKGASGETGTATAAARGAKLDDLESVHLPDHGTFFFGPTSFDVKIPKQFKFDPSDDWDSHQRKLLDDEIINPTIEAERCASYNFPYTNRTTRRRLFLGTLLADDSFEVLNAVSTEIYNIFHTVSFIESNVTHNLSPRTMRFHSNETGVNENVYRLYQMYGPNTKVSVDYYSSHMRGGHDLLRDFVQREGNNLRWKMNGMRVDDVAIVGDTDETFTRDFLRALQICDIPEFRPGQTCNNPGIRASTFVFESTPECLTKGRRWYHPDAMIGECVDQIGDLSKHPHGKREWPDTPDVKDHTIYHGYRSSGYGQHNGYSLYHAENKFDSGHIPYPLYYATDQRMEGGNQVQKKDGSPTGYHFHNFFESEKDIHHKYLTYGHAWQYGLKPIWDIHEDITLAAHCSRGNYGVHEGITYKQAVPFSEITTSQKPIYYIKELNRLTRHRKWNKIMHDEESWWNRQKQLHPQNIVVVNENNGAVEKAMLVETLAKTHEKSNLKNESSDDDENDDDGYDDDDDSEPHPHVYTWDDLKQKYQEGHGTFFFGPHSRQIDIPEDAKYKPNLTDEQRQLLDDEKVDPEKEKERCANYNFDYDGRTERRRLFLGTLLADDSMDILKAVGLEMYNIFHTVSFIESNVTHNLSPRQMRFYESDKPSQNLYQLYQYFGPKTRVSVDYYSNHMQGGYDLLRDFIQREGNNFRWALNGMKPDDVAVVGDTDETFTRDFLRALQICDIPQFRPGQDCRSPKIRASTFVFESTPECVTKNRRWYHPDAILGECVDQIGNITMHPPTKRDWPHNPKEGALYHGWRLPEWGRGDDYSSYINENKWFEEKYGHKPYPLYYATDVRMEYGHMISKKDGSPTGYHFHNFFKSNTEIHNKYKTYGHADRNAWNLPIWEIHEDIALAVDCTHGKYETTFQGRTARSEDFSKLTSSELPVYFRNPENRKQRHDQWQKIIKDDEIWWKKLQNPDGTADEEADGLTSDWDSSKSAVLGLASGYGLNVYQQFVGSLRSTGYSGHIILGISSNADASVIQYLKEQNVTTHVVEPAEKCTYDGTKSNYGQILDTKNSHEWHCPKKYPDYKLTWARFLFFKDWLDECPACTDGIMLTDVRDAVFQADPFVAAVNLKQQAPLMVFEEHPDMNNTHWLTDVPVYGCRKYKVGATPVLCSGSTMGSREGILDYLSVMVKEFDYWKTREECRFDMRGDDQSIHNYLYYSKQFKNAVSIPHRTGPIHVIGYQAARILEKVQAGDKIEGTSWNDWLPQKYGLTDPKTGYTVNMDGRVSPQVHQVDRFWNLQDKWFQRMMGSDKWTYNQRDMFCTREGSQELPTPSHAIPMNMEFIIDFEEVRKFANTPLEKIKGFTISDYEQYMMSPAGKEHYALLNYLSQTFADCRHIVDIGTRYVSSALAMASNLKTPVWTFDLPSSNERLAAFRGKTEDEWQKDLREVGANITFYNEDLMRVSDEDFNMYLGTWFIMLDTHHRPYTVPFEIQFFKRVVDSGYKGIMLLDDIDEHDEMRRWWKELQDGAAAGGYRTFDVSPVGHWSGTGIVDFSGKMIVKDGAKIIQPLSGR